MTKYSGFTLAEVLITLGIIGVVAALTIPGLITTYKAHQLRSQFLKSYSTIQQAFKQMEADDVSLDPRTYGRHEFYRTFANYVKVALDCGANEDGMKRVPSCLAWGSANDKTYKTLNGSSNFDITYLDDGQIVLMDGTNLLFENTSGTDQIYISVDINGFSNKPNRAGYDLFTFQFLDGELLTMGDKNTSFQNANIYCNPLGQNILNGISCAYKAKNETDYFKKIIKEFK